MRSMSFAPLELMSSHHCDGGTIDRFGLRSDEGDAACPARPLQPLVNHAQIFLAQNLSAPLSAAHTLAPFLPARDAGLKTGLARWEGSGA